MATVAEWQKIDANQVQQSLQAACEKVNSSDGELVLDFSSVHRIDTKCLQTLTKLAAVAEEKSVKLVLRGITVDVYRVLKLARLSHRFSFLN